MDQETRDAIQALYLHVYFRGGKALRGRKLNKYDEELFKATSIVSDYLDRTRTLVEIHRDYDSKIGAGVRSEWYRWSEERKGNVVLRLGRHAMAVKRAAS
jgi:hypothetical protein